MLLRQAAAQLSTHYKNLEELELCHSYHGLRDYDININNEKGGAGLVGWVELNAFLNARSCSHKAMLCSGIQISHRQPWNVTSHRVHKQSKFVSFPDSFSLRRAYVSNRKPRLRQPKHISASV